ncbi:aconitase iron-sulfur domain-containing protein [Xylariaceae sp. AK1471]|nr:aconitase iron-sulfur domain-containing protein [Xylariaceae sp. AK1471]
MDLNTSMPLPTETEAQILFLLSAYLEAVKSAERSRHAPRPLSERPRGRRAMTMAEKIFAAHDISRKGWVKAGEVIQVDVDWILASELAWAGMNHVYESVGRPGIFRNDRFWLAGDHRVEPALYDLPDVKRLMDASRRAHEEFKMTEFQGFNYTIMHTEFVRERALPGQLIIGADSHSCSAGAVSCLSIGMGSTDVVMPLITGQTWFSVPETVSIHFTGRPPKGIGGKDTILYILKEFKRNTVAADRIVEFSGPGLQYLSGDARFAIANMCTEFGAVTGIFESDERTLDFISRRVRRKYREDAVFFRPDPDAEYAEQCTIDLSQVTSFVALYPSPDNVAPVTDLSDYELDGCFIGACTTAEEDLIIGALVLQAGLDQGFEPANKGRRLVVPGSRPTRRKLEDLGLLDVYRRAGFNVGVPGCSMCIGQGTDKAQPGEHWLSSQNRNFKNRMGQHSIGNIAAAATVTASSFAMRVTDPQPLLDKLDLGLLTKYLRYNPIKESPAILKKFHLQAKEESEVKSDEVNGIAYHEPYGLDAEEEDKSCTETVGHQAVHDDSGRLSDTVPSPQQDLSLTKPYPDTRGVIKGKVMRLGDFIDTDAIIPTDFLHLCETDDEFGSHCMQFFMPEFRDLAQNQDHSIIVAGKGFGVGSSREVAVNALKGCGIKCVIAESFAFIYARNQPNLGLLGIRVPGEGDAKKLYDIAQMGTEIEVDTTASVIRCGGHEFHFELSAIEKQLIQVGGIMKAFERFGKGLFDKLCQPENSNPQKTLMGHGAGAVADIESLPV